MSENRHQKRHGPLTFEHIREYSDVDASTGCWNWNRCVASNGYGHVRENQRTQTAHRRSFELFHGITLPASIDVCHQCDNRQCVNPDHLFAGSRKVNMADCAGKQRTNKVDKARGEGTGTAKLTDHAVRAIRASNLSQSQLAEKFGVSKRAIGFVKNGRTWRHVK